MTKKIVFVLLFWFSVNQTVLSNEERFKNIDIGKSGFVEIPLVTDDSSSVKFTGGWVISNERQVVDYGYLENSSVSTIKHAPTMGYGDLIFMDVYPDIDKIDFFMWIAAYYVQSDIEIDYCNNMRKPIWPDDDFLIIRVEKAIDQVLLESNIKDQAIRMKILDEYKAMYLGKPNVLHPELVKSKASYVFNNIQRYPPRPLFQVNRHSLTGYAARRAFSSYSAKTGTAFIPSVDATASTKYLSMYPAVAFNVYEGKARYWDRLSIDLGYMDNINSQADTSFKESDKRLMFGVGYDIGFNFALQAGVVYTNGGKDTDGYYGISLDILKIYALLTDDKY